MSGADRDPVAPSCSTMTEPTWVHRPTPTATWVIPDAGGRGVDEVEIRATTHARDGQVVYVRRGRDELRLTGSELEDVSSALRAAIDWDGQ